jgi:hypothetical protein
MKFTLVRKIEKDKEDVNMEEAKNIELFDDNLIQHEAYDETKGDNEMGRGRPRKEVIEETEEDLRIKAEAMKRMQNMENFPSIAI